MKILKSIIIFSIFILALSACGSGQLLGPKYELFCEVDTESYKYWIEGDEGEFSEQNVSDMTRSQTFGPGGDLESVEIEFDQKRTYSESGNVYYFKGTVAVNFVQDTVSYEITATGDTLDGPQTCKSD
jgi:hypothetical protein